MTEQPDRARHAFFGRRKGHRLRPAQADILDRLLPQLALDLARPAPTVLSDLFLSDVNTVRLEIGFGGGEHLLAEAERNPQAGFIGCEPFVNGMAKVLGGIAARDLSNIRLHHGDAAEVLGWLPQGSLSRIDLIHPDPWPKRRHWKRRFIQDERLAELAHVLQTGGELRFVTDWEDYATWALEHVLRAPAFVWTAERADDWRRPWPDFRGTRYEAKARRAGRSSSYLIFRKK
jgi:tRNA (guanine-N7-)-methyltransferase